MAALVRPGEILFISYTRGLKAICDPRFKKREMIQSYFSWVSYIYGTSYVIHRGSVPGDTHSAHRYGKPCRHSCAREIVHHTCQSSEHSLQRTLPCCQILLKQSSSHYIEEADYRKGVAQQYISGPLPVFWPLPPTYDIRKIGGVDLQRPTDGQTARKLSLKKTFHTLPSSTHTTACNAHFVNAAA